MYIFVFNHPDVVSDVRGRVVMITGESHAEYTGHILDDEDHENDRRYFHKSGLNYHFVILENPKIGKLLQLC